MQSEEMNIYISYSEYNKIFNSKTKQVVINVNLESVSFPETLIDMLNKALTAHELIKIDVMKGCTLPVMEVAIDLSNKLSAELVTVMGRVIVLFRRNKENPKIKI